MVTIVDYHPSRVADEGSGWGQGQREYTAIVENTQSGKGHPEEH